MTIAWPSSSAATLPNQFLSPVTGEATVIARSRTQTSRTDGSPNQSHRREHKNEDHDYKFFEGRRRPGSDRIYAADGVYRAGIRGHFRQCGHEREFNLEERQQPAVECRGHGRKLDPAIQT